jgi:hypothetical protein
VHRAQLHILPKNCSGAALAVREEQHFDASGAHRLHGLPAVRGQAVAVRSLEMPEPSNAQR